jgi:hypothetical protein
MVTATASALGWIRRRDLDGDVSDVWEIPLGAYVASPKGTEPVVVNVSSYFPDLRPIDAAEGKAGG